MTRRRASTRGLTPRARTIDRAASTPEPTVGIIPNQHTAYTLLGTIRWLRGDPEHRRVVPESEAWKGGGFSAALDLASFLGWFRARLDDKITASDPRAPSLNHRGRPIRRLDPDYRMRLRRDSWRIRDFLERRIVNRGSGLETPEGRRGCPELHARCTDLDYW